MSPSELLSEAVEASDSARVAKTLDDYPELKSQLGEPLLGAVQRTDRKTIDVLLAGGADINAVRVLDECSPSLAPFLIERGALPDARSAARLGMLDRLREFPVDNTVLHFASTLEIAEYLLDRGADIDAPDAIYSSTPAQHMIRVVQARHFPRDRQDIARFLVDRGCQTDIFMATALGDLPLVRKHLDQDPECIRARVSTGVYIDSLGPNSTPCIVARDFGQEEIFRLLTEFGQTCEYDRLPDAARSNDAEAVRLMLDAGSPVDATGQYDLTALQWASWHGNAEAVREILRHKPKDLELRSALNGSENSWHRDTGDYAAVVKALIEAGVEPPKLTDDLEASPAIREVLQRGEQRFVSFKELKIVAACD
jgi:ankyrin repeat protein